LKPQKSAPSVRFVPTAIATVSADLPLAPVASTAVRGGNLRTWKPGSDTRRLAGSLAMNADHRAEAGRGDHADHHTRELLRIR
jgi:hypothetical protein